MTSGPRILVTGATGFLGTALSAHLQAAGWTVREAVRTAGPRRDGVEQALVPDLLDRKALDAAVRDATAVLHLAGLAHRRVPEGDGDPHWRVNAEGTRCVAEAAVAAGVERVVLSSSVKAVADASEARLDASTEPRPADPYGRSKLAAERLLDEVAGDAGVAAVSLRLPLVYGPGVGANMLRLFRLVRSGLPLPFGAVSNRRSLLYVGNLARAVDTALRAPSGRYFVSDDADLSTPDLVRSVAAALGRPARLIPVPERLLRAVLGGSPLIESLAVDCSPLRSLGYAPEAPPEEALRVTGAWFLRQERR